VARDDRAPVFRRRCERCGRRACVVYADVLLCGDCFLEQTMQRYSLEPKSSGGLQPAGGLKAAATP
jgi:hypothetical protein